MEALPKSLEASVSLADAVSHRLNKLHNEGALLGPRHPDNVRCVRAVCVCAAETCETVGPARPSWHTSPNTY